MKNAIRYMFTASILLVSQTSFAAEEQMVCKVNKQSQSADRYISLEDLRKDLAAEGCQKGDLLYLSDNGDEVFHVCDFEEPFATTSSMFLCTYIGYVRERRNPGFVWRDD